MSSLEHYAKRLLASSASHKISNWEASFAALNIPSGSLQLTPNKPEPETVCPMKLGVQKLKYFFNGEELRDKLVESGDSKAVLATMDVGAALPANGQFGVVPVTTCREVVPAIEKVTSTMGQVYERRSDDVGKISFFNTCGYCGYMEGKLYWERAKYETAQLSLSIPMVELLADPASWEWIEAIYLDNPQKYQRNLLNPKSLGAMDFSVFGKYVDVIMQISGKKDLSISWSDQYGNVWTADGRGETPGMVEEMTEFLRGFRRSTIYELASLPI